jgi:DNA-binding NarL/FixJ family response regulator
MPEPLAESLAAGQAALARADWGAARAAFDDALRAEPNAPDAHDGLGVALWWLNEIEACHAARAAAYVEFKRRGHARRAAHIAAWLAREQVFLRQNPSAMNGWFARAKRLLAGEGPCAERGWLDLWRASMLAPPDELERVSRQTLELARQAGDDDLQVAALAFGGLGRVSRGDVAGGMDSLDEAMAAATGGEVASHMVASEVFCVTLSACEMSGDLVRTEHWCQAAREYAERNHCAFLSAYCRTTYGGLLALTGRWRDAEAELAQAIQMFERGHRGLRVHAVIRLAELRVWQGRLEEAEVLLSGLEDHGAAAVPLARLHLARGQPKMARALLEAALADGQASLAQAPAWLVWVDAALALGDLAEARRGAEQLGRLAEQAGSDLLLAQADLARARASRPAGAEAAVAHYRSALARLQRYEQSALAARVKLALARSLAESDPPAAVMWARAALATFERLGAAQAADEAASTLREMGAPGRPAAPGRAAAGAASPLTEREAEVLRLLGRGLSNRAIAARLVISVKTVEHHVSRVLSKLGLRSRAEAAAYAAQRGA